MSCTDLPRLRAELEQKDQLAAKLESQLSQSTQCGGQLLEELARKRRQIRKKKEQLRRMENDG